MLPTTTKTLAPIHVRQHGCFAHDMQTARAKVRTANPSVTGWPTLPTEPHPPIPSLLSALPPSAQWDVVNICTACVIYSLCEWHIWRAETLRKQHETKATLESRRIHSHSQTHTQLSPQSGQTPRSDTWSLLVISSEKPWPWPTAETRFLRVIQRKCALIKELARRDPGQRENWKQKKGGGRAVSMCYLQGVYYFFKWHEQHCDKQKDRHIWDLL